MAFRDALTAFRLQLETEFGTKTQSSNGFFIINELRVPRRRDTYSPALLQAYQRTLRAICKTLEMPIQYAGPGNWQVFDKPAPYDRLRNTAVPIPGTLGEDVCLVVRADLWQTFLEMSLWIEALCIHEWALFTERVEQENGQFVQRGQVYQLLTARPDNRRPLTWERNHIEVLLMEGKEFICPWTEQHIRLGTDYDIDHLIPVSMQPINELWHLVPADRRFNSHVKRDRLPSLERLGRAEPHLVLAYTHYEAETSLAQAIQEDVAIRFSTVTTTPDFPRAVARVVVEFIEQFAEARNLARFE